MGRFRDNRHRSVSRPTFVTFNEFIRRRRNRRRRRRGERSNDYGRKPYINKPVTEEDVQVEPDLDVDDVNLNVLQNAAEHHTNEYDLNERNEHLVVRRGQTFETSIKLNRKYDEDKYDLKLVLEADCDNPLPTKGTKVSIPLSLPAKGTTASIPDAGIYVKDNWGACIWSYEDSILNVRIGIPKTCFVGKWILQVDIDEKANKKDGIEYTHDQKIYVLFNPWCKDDPVYKAEENLRKEYILNDTGKIYTGTKKRIRGKAWNFGQFETDILDCAMYLLDKVGKLSWEVRGDPVKVCRKLSAVANCQDDNGVLVGNWSGDYEGGTHPCDWTGSVAILQKFFATKEPVCYGQCWVFSGLLTSLNRTLGIPARSVTNFASAHDTDGSTTIDNFFDDDCVPLEELNCDSVWNFHVWNEVWMARLDLPKGIYGGWQVVDATPQETSEGVFCCGPASLAAVKRGEVYLPYDCSFVFAEVNADRLNWKIDSKGEHSLLKVDKYGIGKNISTKLPIGMTNDKFEWFCWDKMREDLTNNYKFPDGSDEERAAVYMANQNSTKKGVYLKDEQADVEFELVEKETIPYGKDIEIVLKMKNTSNERRTVNGRITTGAMFYTGVPRCTVRTQPVDREVIPAKSEKQVEMLVAYDEYYPYLVEGCFMKMSCLCKVDETKQAFASQDDFQLIKPEITIKVPLKGKVAEKMAAEFSFQNPLPCSLTQCKLTVEGPGLQEPTQIDQRNVGANQTFMTSMEFTPKKPGMKTLIVSFNSKEMIMVDGSAEIEIE